MKETKNITYRIMVQVKGEGVKEPVQPNIRDRRFNSRDAAEIYVQGINDYRAHSVARQTSKYVVREAGYEE